jgi:hypothetical protein
MREVTIVHDKYTRVHAVDEEDNDGVNHLYTIEPSTNDKLFKSFANIQFQNGPIKENGVNGCHVEDLLAIVIDRIQSWQNGEMYCRENALAITKAEECLHWLNHRTRDRENRGVLGTKNK